MVLAAVKKARMAKKLAKKTIKKKILQGKTPKKVILQEKLSDESIHLQISTIESTYNIDDDGFNDRNADTFDVPEGRFIIVMVCGYGKQSSRNYTAKVVKKVEGGYEVEFYKRKIPSNSFIRTIEELAFIADDDDITDVVRALAVPTEDKRSRFKDMIYFKCNLDEYQSQ